MFNPNKLNNLVELLSTQMRNPVVIILLSDIQIGRFGIIKSDDRPGQVSFMNDLIKQIQSITTDFVTPPIYVLFGLGDLASTAHLKEYDTVEEELLRIAAHLKIERNHIFLCPGNHDFDFNLSLDEKRANDKFSSYCQFHNDFYTQNRLDKYPNLRTELTEDQYNWLTEQWDIPCGEKALPRGAPGEMFYFNRLDDLEMEVLVFNSAHLYTSDINSQYGHFPIEIIESKLKPDILEPQNGYTRILLGHHSVEPLSEEDISSIRNIKELKTFLFKNGFRFYFHGHQHYYEQKKWIESEKEVHIIGCGPTSASRSEIITGDNQFTTLVLGRFFIEINSHEFNGVYKTWTPKKEKIKIPTSNKTLPLFDGQIEVKEANHELILSAQHSIYQTFINSNFPNKEDDSLRCIIDKIKQKNISVKRLLLINNFDGILFAEDCLELKNDNYPEIQLELLKNWKNISGPNFNFLVVDHSDIIVMQSKPDNWNTSGFYINSSSIAGQLAGFYENSNDITQITSEILQKLKKEIVKNHPHTIAESVLNELASKFGNEVIFFGAVGSAVKETSTYTLLNDLDLIIIVEKVTSDFLNRLNLEFEDAIEQKSNQGIKMVLEYRDGPIRPMPLDKVAPIFQLHVLIYDKRQAELWPEFIKRTHILNYRSARNIRLEDIVRIGDNLKNEILNHDVWGLSKLILYCQNSYFPTQRWITTNENSDPEVSSNKEFLNNVGDKLEFYGYIISKSILNFLILIKGNDIKEISEDSILKKVKDIIPSDILLNIKPILEARKKYRMEGEPKIKLSEIKQYQNNSILFLKRLQKLISGIE